MSEWSCTPKQEFYLFLVAQTNHLRNKVTLCEGRLRQKKEELQCHEETLSLVEQIRGKLESVFEKGEINKLQEIMSAQEEKEV